MGRPILEIGDRVEHVDPTQRATHPTGVVAGKAAGLIAVRPDTTSEPAWTADRYEVQPVGEPWDLDAERAAWPAMP
jgi:hypothetical protein